MTANQIKVKPNSIGARYVLKSQEVSKAIIETFVKGRIPKGAVIETDENYARRNVRVKKYGEYYAPLKRHEQETGELLSFLSTIGNPSRRKHSTRLTRNRKHRRKMAARRRRAGK